MESAWCIWGTAHTKTSFTSRPCNSLGNHTDGLRAPGCLKHSLHIISQVHRQLCARPDPSALKISVFKGDVVLRNLKLKPEALADWSCP